MTPKEARAEIERIEIECKRRTQAIRDIRNAEVEAVYAEYSPRLAPLWRISRGETEEAPL